MLTGLAENTSIKALNAGYYAAGKGGGH